jgi:hypothetical protein
MQPVFSLAYTTIRPNYLANVVKTWNDRSALKAHEWVVSLDTNRMDCIDAARQVGMQIQQAGTGCAAYQAIVQKEPPFNCVRGWNLAASQTQGKVIICVADDFMPPENWDTQLLAVRPGWEDGEYVVKVEDGYVHDIFVLSILTRKRYQKFGYVFYPKYESMFCDTEFGEVAKRDGVVINAQHLLFEHLHPDCNKRPRDQVDLSHASKDRWDRGEILFKFRASQNFPLDDGPLAAPPPPVHGQPMTPSVQAAAPPAAAPTAAPSADYCAYLQVTKNDFCLEEVCDRLREEGVNTFFMAIPDEYWFTQTPVTDAEVAQIEAVAASLRAKGSTVHTKKFDVSSYRFPGDQLVKVEARLRNDSLSWIRSHGFERILIVDGDELWFKGTLSAIDACVREGIQSVSCRMVPVIGLPGYPVDKATDLAVVYIGGQAQFSECRTPRVQPVKLPMPMVFHFTATRRTREEIEAKMRVGGHYDDKDYLFEEWIEKVLPNIKPGFQHTWPSGHKGLHMYNPYQIWPNVRNWRPEELAQIPASLHQYLALEPKP